MGDALRHASFFSGVGGLDLGFERAGWDTVSFSEIEPYACAVLAERWPGVPNLGNILDVSDIPEADLWTGGFPLPGHLGRRGAPRDGRRD